MFSRFLFVSLFLLLTSCGGRFDRIDNGGFTTVTFKRSDRHLASILTGGILIYAYSNSYITNLFLNDEAQNAQIALPNGQYSFFAFGYANPFVNTTAYDDIRCAVVGTSTPVSLTGSAQTVSLNLMESNCVNAAFEGSLFYDANLSSTLANSGPIFGEIDIIHCGSSAGTQLQTIAATQDCSTSGGGISASWAGVSAFRVNVPLFVNANGTYTKTGNAYYTACTDSYPSTSGSVASNQHLRFPIGATNYPGLFPISIETYSETACTSPALAVHNFVNGIVNGISSSAYLSTVQPNTSGTQRARLYLREP